MKQKNPGQAEPRNVRNLHAYLLVWLDSVIGGQSWGEMSIKLFSRFILVILLPPKYLKMVRLYLFLEFHV